MLDWIRFDRRQYETHTTLQGRRRCGQFLSCDYTIPLLGMVYVLKMLLEKYVDRLQEGAGCEIYEQNLENLRRNHYAPHVMYETNVCRSQGAKPCAPSKATFPRMRCRP